MDKQHYKKIISICVILLLSILQPLSAAEVLIKKILILGNGQLSHTAIMKVIGLQAGRSYDFSRIKKAFQDLLRFYKKRGYAYVAINQANIRFDGTLVFQVDEGAIHSIRILNKNIYTIYRFKRALRIKDGEVFNRIKLDAEMERLRKKFHLKELKYISKPVNGEKHLRNIFIDARGYKAKSFSYTFDAEAFYLIPKISYRNYDFWGLDHEIYLYARTKVEWMHIYDHVFGLSYYTPSIFGKIFRPYINSELSLLSESRQDMNIDYAWDRLKIGLFMENRLSEYVNIRVGLVHTFYSIHDIEQIDSGKPISSLVIPTGSQSHSSFLISFNLVDPESRFNRDKAFRLYATALFYINSDKQDFYRFSLFCQKTFERDQDDFVLNFRYRFISGKAPYFYDVDTAAVALRGYATDSLFTRHLIALRSEYKLSLWNNWVKLVFFTDTALFRPLSYNGHLEQKSFELKGSFGEGIEINYSEFSFRFFYGIPYQNKLTDGRVKVQLKKVF